MINLFGLNREQIIQENTIEAGHMPELAINSDIANITFLTHDKQQVNIVLETYEKGPELQVNVVNEKLEINARVQKERRIGIIVQPKSCKLEVKLPKNFADHYTIQTSAGNISAADLVFNQAFLKTGAGNIRLENMNATKVELESGAGNIKVKSIDSVIFLAESGAGNIEGSLCTGSITARTGSGNVRFTVNGEQDLKMKSGAGNINVLFTRPENLNATIKASAGLGNVKSELPSHKNKNTTNELSSAIGKGENSFHFKTGVGNIHLAKENY